MPTRRLWRLFSCTTRSALNLEAFGAVADVPAVQAGGSRFRLRG
jgi:hypothetical protein